MSENKDEDTQKVEPEKQKVPSGEPGMPSKEGEPTTSVVWGEKREITKDKPIQYRLGESTFTIKQRSEGVISVNEEETDDPPFLASAGKGRGKGYIRMGHERGTMPIILRFPRPVLILPGATFECFSTYPTTPALHYEKEDGTSSKLLELPGVERKKTYYGTLTDGILCHLHYGEHVDDPDQLPDDSQHAIVRVKMKNHSADPQEAGILLINPANIDYYVLEERLCLCRITLDIQSDQQADVHYTERPSLKGADLVEKRSDTLAHSQALNLLRSVMGDSAMKEGY